MQENEFEKQVKEMMEELQFPPSATVWEKIKKHISKKKRRVIPFFLLVATVVILSGYLFYTDQKHHNQGSQKNYSAIHNVEPKNSTSNNIKNQNSLQPNLIFEDKFHKPSALKKTEEHFYTSINKSFKKDETIILHQPLIKENNNDESNDSLSSENSALNNKVPEENDSSFTWQQSNAISFFKDSVFKNNTDTSIQKNADFVKNDSAILKTYLADKKLNQRNKWQFGISAMYGKSVIRNNLLNFNLNKSSPSNIFGPGTAFSDTAKALKDPYKIANAYNFGIIVTRQISRHSYLNTGLNFVHLSSKSNTARSIDSSLILIEPGVQNSSFVNGYYRTGSAETFINNFNFISLPITFQSDLLQIKKFSVSYNAGLSAMQLISSKSLIYNDNNNSFFSNDELIRHTQFQLTAGLNLQISTKKNGMFSLSPDLKYSFSTLLKNNDYNRLHFLNYGLQAAWLFKKK